MNRHEEKNYEIVIENVTVLAPYVFKLCWLWSVSVFSSAWLWTSYIVRAKEPLSLFIFFVSL